MMNSQPTQPDSNDSQHPDPDRSAILINAALLSDIAELLNILDGFLRHADGIANRLADYLHATGRDRPHPPDWTSYDTNLLIDQVSFTAHNLACPPPKTATVTTARGWGISTSTPGEFQ